MNYGSLLSAVSGGPRSSLRGREASLPDGGPSGTILPCIFYITYPLLKIAQHRCLSPVGPPAARDKWKELGCKSYFCPFPPVIAFCPPVDTLPWACSDSKEINWAPDDQGALLPFSTVSSTFFPLADAACLLPVTALILDNHGPLCKSAK